MDRRLVFLDSNGWIALLNASDALHSLADTTWRSLMQDSCLVVLTDWIIAETGNGLSRTAARTIFAKAARLLTSDQRVVLVNIESDLLQAALRLYEDRGDKTWGLVDCASFLVMRRYGIGDAFTSDQHFRAGGLYLSIGMNSPFSMN